MDIVTAGRNLLKVRKCIVAGFFTNAAKKDPTEDGGEPAGVHPPFIFAVQQEPRVGDLP